MNQLTFSGRVTSDPVFRYLPSGTGVVNFTLAQTQTRQGREYTTFLRCALFGNDTHSEETDENGELRLTRLGYMAEIVAKGHEVTVSGRLDITMSESVTAGVKTKYQNVQCIVQDFD